MVTAIGNTQSTVAALNAADDAKLELAEDFDDFLTLLVTQLENQDPLDPQDSSEFTNQIVQFTGVEQQIGTNDKLDELISGISVGQSTNLVSYVGKAVETVGNLVTLPEATQLGDETIQGELSFAYNLDEAVENVFIAIKDTSGRTVFTGEGANLAGRNSVTWNGINNDGNYEPAGTYQVVVTAADANDDVTALDTYVSGIVEGVNYESDEPTLIINGEIIPTDSIRFIGTV